MKRLMRLLFACLASGMSAADPLPRPGNSALAPLPDPHGFAGMFAGVVGGVLLCAGGANFPEKPLAQGGRKVWSDRVFVLSTLDGSWREVGRLPRANGYGVSASWHNALVMAGGGDATGNFRNVSLLRWDGERLAFAPLPDLPMAVANGCGALVGDVLYIAGGQETTTATSALQRCFALDLADTNSGWRKIPWPHGAPGRILAVAGAYDGWLYLFSGADLHPNAQGQPERNYLTDAWRYRASLGWQRLADLPHAVAAAPSPAMPVGNTYLAIAGGVSPEFLATLPETGPHPGFPGGILVYNFTTDTWAEISATHGGPPPRVTSPMCRWRDRFVVPSGEIAPGIRTPTVLSLQYTP